MKKALILPIAIATISLSGLSAFAATTSTSTATTTQTNQSQTPKFDGRGGGHMGGGMMNNLTDAEKTALQSMSETEKQAFFDKKRTEAEAKMTARDTVIDKLLAGTALTADEEALRKTIITERAARKTEMAARKAEMEKVKAALEKQKAGTTLTADEQALLAKMPQRGQGGPRGQGGGQARSTSGSTTPTSN